MLKTIWIFILVSIVANIIGTVGKANQKKKPITSSPKKVKQTGYNFRDQGARLETDESYINDLGYKTSSVKQNADSRPARSFTSYNAEEAASVRNEPVGQQQDEHILEEESFFNIGLSEFQHAMVMTEILNKPLALRKK